jgi:twitching motility protein PilT
VTGPTGSGKTTTQAALIDYINQNFAKHVVTIEEPIEFVHDNKRSTITQREVPTDSSSFAAGLKAALREDTDIVLVGEMRDLETVSLALTAAETGLLVFGTLHTNNARKTVDRMVDVFPADRQPQARAMLANSLRGVVAQLLLKRADRPGRIAVNEILIANAAVAAIIREGATQKLQDVVHGRRDLGAPRKRHCLPARSFHESDRQKPVQTISASRGRSARQRCRCRPKRRETAFRQPCKPIGARAPIGTH